MSWYYAENNERRGPIEESEFQALVRAGTVQPETLVWREGMAEWVPFREVPAGASASAGVPVSDQPASTDISAKACTQCGRLFPADEMIVVGGRSICASCKPVVIQQMMEGAPTAGAALDPVQFLADLRARGGYKFRVGELLSRAWALVRGNFWPCLGTTALAYLVMIASQQIPCVGILAPFLITGPIIGGLFLYFIKQLRGQPATVGDAFSGFNKPQFGQLALAGTVQTLIVLVLMAVLIGPGVALNWTALQENPEQPPVMLMIWIFVALIPVWYLTLAWILCYPLIIDQRVPFWQAMELSRKVVTMNLGGWLLLFLANFALGLAGLLALCVGLFVVLPVSFASIAAAYEQIISSRGSAGPSGATPRI